MIGLYLFLIKIMEQPILDFLKLHISHQTTLTDWFSVIVYAFTLGVAFWAAFTAKQALKENQKITRVHIEPFITVKIDHMNESINWFRLKITNEGLGHAFNIKLDIENDNKDKYSELSNKILARISGPTFMVKGLKHLSPSEMKFSNLFSVDRVTGQEQQSIDMFFNLIFRVKVTYQDKNASNFEREYILDFSEYKDIERISMKSVHENQLEEFKKINKNLRDLNVEQRQFKNEYEKAHRDWNEDELRAKVRELDRQKKLHQTKNIKASVED